MKFARDFQEALRREEYPQEWVQSAIPYKKLKKCIKRVQEELHSLGLDPETLEKLWQQGSLSTPVEQTKNSERFMHYDFLSSGDVKFVPKLTIALDPTDGSPMDAWLSPETRRFLRRYGRRASSVALGKTNGRVSEIRDSGDLSLYTSSEQSEEESRDDHEDGVEEPETIEIPLTSDSEFFQILQRELVTLEELQNNEQRHLEDEIVKLGDNLREMQVSKKKASKEQLDAWRDIFRLYSEAQIFFSSHERDAGKRDAAHAQEQMTLFLKALSAQQKKMVKFSPEGAAAQDRFMRINFELLKFMKYQEINAIALTKIMKKFDKQTALHAREGALVQIKKTPFMTQDLAKATCFTMSEELLKLIPQMDDYLCPICFSLAWKPIRLRCGHVFCIRCLIVMQRADKEECALCREKVVLEATSGKLPTPDSCLNANDDRDDIDHELSKFMKQNFSKDVKQKQRENEIAAGVDQFGESFESTHRCAVM